MIISASPIWGLESNEELSVAFDVIEITKCVHTIHNYNLYHYETSRIAENGTERLWSYSFVVQSQRHFRPIYVFNKGDRFIYAAPRLPSSLDLCSAKIAGDGSNCSSNNNNGRCSASAEPDRSPQRTADLCSLDASLHFATASCQC